MASFKNLSTPGRDPLSVQVRILDLAAAEPAGLNFASEAPMTRLELRAIARAEPRAAFSLRRCHPSRAVRADHRPVRIPAACFTDLSGSGGPALGTDHAPRWTTSRGDPAGGGEDETLRAPEAAHRLRTAGKFRTGPASIGLCLLPGNQADELLSGTRRLRAEWRDQAAIAIRLPGKSLGFALNRDRVLSDEELLVLELLQPHLERVLHRSTQYLNLATEQPLTPREREVLHWVAEGKRNSEIAQFLG